MWPFSKKQEQMSYPNTPDLAILENKPQHLLFHYGDEFSHVPLICGGFTDEKMIMWTSRTGVCNFPVALQLHVNRNIPRGRIGGWVYQVTADDLIYLDTHMQNGVQFHRKRVKLRLPGDSETRNHEYRHYTEQRAYMYVGVRKHWQPQIEWDSCFHRGNGTAEFVPATCRIAGSANYSEDSWVRRYFEFQRRKPESTITKTYIYFKGSRRQAPVEEPFVSTPADEMYKPMIRKYDNYNNSPF